MVGYPLLAIIRQVRAASGRENRCGPGTLHRAAEPYVAHPANNQQSNRAVTSRRHHIDRVVLGSSVEGPRATC
jgi:hypothetical protein